MFTEFKEVETIHGFPILGSVMAPGAPGFRYILVDREGYGYMHRYATAMHKIGEREWFSGHYFSDYDDACLDLSKRIVRESYIP
jgi:hypothetical protein